MGDEKDAQAAADASKEDSIKVICRFRPLNDTEEKTGSKFIIKFPSGSDDQCVSIAVIIWCMFKEIFQFIVVCLG